MQVLSPVGVFAVSLDRVRLRGRQPVLDLSMGAWRSEATLERRDLPYVGVGAGVLVGAFLLGRRSGRAAASFADRGAA